MRYMNKLEKQIYEATLKDLNEKEKQIYKILMKYTGPFSSFGIVKKIVSSGHRTKESLEKYLRCYGLQFRNNYKEMLIEVIKSV